MSNVGGGAFFSRGTPILVVLSITLRQKAGYSVVRSPRGVYFRTENDERLRYQELGSPYLKSGPSAKVYEPRDRATALLSAKMAKCPNGKTPNY